MAARIYRLTAAGREAWEGEGRQDDFAAGGSDKTLGFDRTELSKAGRDPGCGATRRSARCRS